MRRFPLSPLTPWSGSVCSVFQPSTATLVTSNMTSSTIFLRCFLDNIPSKFQMPVFCWVFQVPIWKAFNDPMTLETFNLPMWAKEWSRSLQPSDIVTRPQLLQHKTMSLCLVRLVVSYANTCAYMFRYTGKTMWKGTYYVESLRCDMLRAYHANIPWHGIYDGIYWLHACQKTEQNGKKRPQTWTTKYIIIAYVAYTHENARKIQIEVRSNIYTIHVPKLGGGFLTRAKLWAALVRTFLHARISSQG